ncbi:F0F1 ATP synthase subunit delta [Gordonia iterans]|uniref:ATP synthase subunit delta n=1 Tax=Gordonia iterans TaxID=1004901 RepID=A0A2S0KEP8_9ACTN|nr:F0F1 ATP synthase subunit delta [Gordonia iterans]AVM00170.1 F0F1 ATP synthase subunit delta [Gordonia iterans]
MYAASSREALDGARVELEAALRGVTSDEAVTVGEELLSFAETVSDHRALRTALADSATAPDARAAVARGLLAGKVGEITQQTVASAAARSWSRDADLATALQELGREAMLQAAKSQGRLDTVEDELFRLARTVKGNSELEQALSDRARSQADRARLLDSLVAGKVDDVTRRLAAQAVVAADEAPGDVLDDLSALAAAANGRKVAYVSAAGELSAAQRTQLSEKLSAVFDAPVTLHVEIDPELLGGVVVRVGDERIDGSIAGKLAALRRSLR